MTLWFSGSWIYRLSRQSSGNSNPHVTDLFFTCNHDERVTFIRERFEGLKPFVLSQVVDILRRFSHITATALIAATSLRTEPRLRDSCPLLYTHRVATTILMKPRLTCLLIDDSWRRLLSFVSERNSFSRSAGSSSRSFAFSAILFRHTPFASIEFHRKTVVKKKFRVHFLP